MDEQYEKASGYDRKAQLRNHRVFLRKIRQRPWKAFALCAFFAVCALMLLLIETPRSAKYPSPWQAWIGAMISAVGSGYFAWQGVLGLRAKK